MSALRNRPKMSLSERAEKLGALVGHLKGFATRPALRAPAWRMLIARSLVYLLPGIGLLMLVIERHVLGGLLLFATPFAAGLLLFFDVGQRGRMAYHVQRIARDEESDKAGANAAISGKRGKLVLLGVVEWLERKLQRRARDGDTGFVMRMIAGAVGEILDVAGAFLVPAVVLDDVTIEEAVRKVKALKNRAPEAFMASVGFDAVASLLRSVFWTPVVLVPIAVMAGVLADIFTVPQAVAAIAVMALLLAVPLAAVQTLREAAKSVYFTALYMLVAHPEEVSDDRSGSLQGLVRMTGKDEDPEPVAVGVA